MIHTEEVSKLAHAHNVVIEVLSPETIDHIRRTIFDRYAPYDTGHSMYERAGTPYVAEDFVNFRPDPQAFMTFGQPHVTINYI